MTAFGVFLLSFVLSGMLAGQTAGDINEKMARINIATATMDDVLKVFGEPLEYRNQKGVLPKENLPPVYVARYPDDFMVFVRGNDIVEFRFHRPGYRFLNALEVGSTLEEVLKVLGPNSGVLEKDNQGVAGNHYYANREKSVRMFFVKDRVTALYVARPDQMAPGVGVPVSTAEVAKFDDVRKIGRFGRMMKDISGQDLSNKADILPTLTFNGKTAWPVPAKMPAGVKPDELVKSAMNPGLGVRDLHRQGITGQGVTVAIIDQAAYQDHPEFEGKVAAYKDFGAESESSMHGPAVASLLVGKNIGTAPGARLYYAATPSAVRDASYFARALEWLIEENRKLSPGGKIRVVSVSAAPSGPGSPFTSNGALWDKAVETAEREGILVLDCTQHHGIIGPAYFAGSDRETPAAVAPGFPHLQGVRKLPKHVLAPTSPRTTAEEYERGDFGYQYSGRAGLSWSIPYVAGVLALGWQENPKLTSTQMVELLFKSAYAKDDGNRIVDPKEFLRAVKQSKTTGQ